jgi:hypothetical protein
MSVKRRGSPGTHHSAIADGIQYVPGNREKNSDVRIANISSLSD